ncbi:MAG: hypothetical protein GKS05_04275 [Nitrospirales bacterium]|nr:hypothetical protein [Nitrospirales bacterium]
MDLKIESRNVGMTPRWQAEIEERVDALQPDYHHITHARVTLTKNPHHKKGEDNAEVLIVLTLPPRHTVTARKEAKTFEEAIRLTFAAAITEIKKIRGKKSASPLPPAAGSLTGVLGKLFPQDAHGFIVQDGGQEVYFHENDLQDCTFSELKTGMAVQFEVVEGLEGQKATFVTPQSL